MKSYKINDNISLKLENDETNIYVNGELFRQCKKIALLTPLEEVDELFIFKSIDEVYLQAKFMNTRENPIISPETEFWAHCSNIQAWVEHGYDTRLLHSNLSFPLLEKLSEVGDRQAQAVFKSEILNRILEGFIPTVSYIFKHAYYRYLKGSERKKIFLDQNVSLYKNISAQFENDSYAFEFIFPLLAELAHLGDKIAESILKEEMIARLDKGRLEDVLYYIRKSELFKYVIDKSNFRYEWFSENVALREHISHSMHFNFDDPNTLRKFPFELLNIFYEMGYPENFLVKELVNKIGLDNKGFVNFLQKELYFFYFEKYKKKLV